MEYQLSHVEVEPSSPTCGAIAFAVHISHFPCWRIHSSLSGNTRAVKQFHFLIHFYLLFLFFFHSQINIWGEVWYQVCDMQRHCYRIYIWRARAGNWKAETIPIVARDVKNGAARQSQNYIKINFPFHNRDKVKLKVFKCLRPALQLINLFPGSQPFIFIPTFGAYHQQMIKREQKKTVHSNFF